MLELWPALLQPRPVAVFNLEFFTEKGTPSILAPRLARWRTLGVQGFWHTLYVTHTAADEAAWPLLQEQACLTEKLAFASLGTEELKVCARLGVVWYAPRLVPLLPMPTTFPSGLPLEVVWEVLRTFPEETDYSLANFRVRYAYA